MEYQLNIDNQTILSGDLLTLGITLLLIVIFLIFLINNIWKRLSAVEKLKYEFITIIAHKFRTPLTQIKWFIETIVETESDPYIKTSLINIDMANQKLIGLTNTLVELTDKKGASVASYNFDRINICDLTGQIAHSLKDTFHKKNLFLAMQCTDSEIFVKADKQRIDFVLQTVIENAVNYSPSGRNIEISMAKEGSKAIIYIKDDGIGIDPNDMHRLFTKFFRAKNAKNADTNGFGVGLYLAQKIMRAHKGKIVAYSEGLNKGTTFTITFPLIK